MTEMTRTGASLRCLAAFAVLWLQGCDAHPIGEPGIGEVRHFERGNAFFEVATTSPFVSIRTYLCTDCTAESFDELEPEYGLEKLPVRRLEARSAEVRKLPMDEDFIGFVDRAGHRFQRDARSVSPLLLGGAVYPCGVPFMGSFCGSIVRLESDRTLRFGAGDLVHELDDGTSRYVLYAAADKDDLASLSLPPGWNQLTRRLDGEMIITTNGFLDVFQDARENLWQRVGIDRFDVGDGEEEVTP
jgi:hypothetical protein